jgi:hypothetical protein
MAVAGQLYFVQMKHKTGCVADTWKVLSVPRARHVYLSQGLQKSPAEFGGEDDSGG